MSSVDASIVLVTKNGAAFLDDVLRRVRLLRPVPNGRRLWPSTRDRLTRRWPSWPTMASGLCASQRPPSATVARVAGPRCGASQREAHRLPQPGRIPVDEGWLGGPLTPLATDTEVAGVCSRITPRSGLQPFARPPRSGGSARLGHAENRWARCP